MVASWVPSFLSEPWFFFLVVGLLCLAGLLLLLAVISGTYFLLRHSRQGTPVQRPDEDEA
jgi:hypothetical protein